MRHLYYTKIFLLIFMLLFIAPVVHALPGNSYVVTNVHDGDTVSIKVRSFAGFPLRIERLRLIGIDAPELKQETWGRRAKRHLKKLISESDWVVNVEFDVELRDKYGRLLGYLWNRHRGVMINEKMVEDGYAVLFTFPPNVRYENRFAEAEKKARAKGLGIWEQGGLKQSPSEWRKQNPSKYSERH
jgi:micrococcal nuclease